MKKGAILAVILPISACTAVTGPDHVGDSYYLGLVHVRAPKTQGPVLASEVSGVGAGIGHGAFVGYNTRREIVMAPGDCGMVLLVERGTDMKQVKSILQAVGGNPCVVDFSGSQP